MRLVYPAIFTPFEGGDGYAVEFPDLPGCVTEGQDLVDAIFMATDAASGWVLTELEDGKEAQEASSISEVVVPEGSFVSLVALDMDEYAKSYGKRS